MSATAFSPDQVLDTSGLKCPMPIVKTSKMMKKMEIGQILQVISTDSGSPPDMEAWAQQTGHAMLDSHRENGQFIFFFRKTK